MITCLDLDDQERLHRFGLLPKVTNDTVDWLALVLKHVQHYIQQALSS